VTPLDVVLALAGLFAATIEWLARHSHRVTWGIIVGLFALSAIPTLLIGSSQRPTDLTFDDVRLDHIPAMTTWVRLEGEMELTHDPYSDAYRLHDTNDGRMYVFVITPAPLPAGHTVVTGRIAVTGTGEYGNVGTIEIDVPAVPKRNEPFWVILLPAALGIVTVLGLHLGYPVIRRDARSAPHGLPLAPGESVSARWSGRIASELTDRTGMPCTISLVPVADMPDLSDLTITDSNGAHVVRIRPASPVGSIRLCWIHHSERGLEVHSSNADLLLTFADRATCDRFTQTLR
jgi:hypothetical protein